MAFLRLCQYKSFIETHTMTSCSATWATIRISPDAASNSDQEA